MGFGNSWVILFLTKTMMVLYIGFPETEEHSFANQLLDHNRFCAGMPFETTNWQFKNGLNQIPHKQA